MDKNNEENFPWKKPEIMNLENFKPCKCKSRKNKKETCAVENSRMRMRRHTRRSTLIALWYDQHEM